MARKAYVSRLFKARAATKHLGVGQSNVGTADLRRVLTEYEQMSEVLLMIRQWGWIGTNSAVDPFKPKETDYAKPHVKDVQRVLAFLAPKKWSKS